MASINWERAYSLLRDADYRVNEIADLAGVSRQTLNRVERGEAPTHEPGYAGGSQVLAAIKDELHAGKLTREQVQQLKDPIG